VDPTAISDITSSSKPLKRPGRTGGHGGEERGKMRERRKGILCIIVSVCIQLIRKLSPTIEEPQEHINMGKHVLINSELSNKKVNRNAEMSNCREIKETNICAVTFSSPNENRLAPASLAVGGPGSVETAVLV
jgi:hypothetical protein